MAPGDKKTITIPFDKAYGPRNPEMIIEMPRNRFPEDMEIELGMPLVMSNGNGQQFEVIVVEMKADAILLDANHPLAGHDLEFDLELVEIMNKPLIIMP
jgi:peptidylprolyl isomerase